MFRKSVQSFKVDVKTTYLYLRLYDSVYNSIYFDLLHTDQG